MAGAAIHRVDAVLAIELVVTGIAAQGVVFFATPQPVIAIAAIKRVETGVADQKVMTIAAVEYVIAGKTEQ